MTDRFIKTNGITLHYLDSGGPGPVILLMHGLTANAHSFDGLMAAGLGDAGRILSVDLRGRGQSDHPEDDYTMEAHALDILGLMDGLGIRKAIVGGHSFGALLTLLLAAKHGDRIGKIILIDAAARLHEDTREMLLPALSRLGKRYDSFESYIAQAKLAPYLSFWEEHMTAYYRADVQEAADGSVMPLPKPENIAAAVNGVLAEPWMDFIRDLPQPALLLNGPGIYTMGAPLLPEDYALETVAIMRQCSYVKVAGNHQTMLYGDGAAQIVAAIKAFVGPPAEEETA